LTGYRRTVVYYRQLHYEGMDERMKNQGKLKQLHPALIALIDVAVIGLALIVFALFDHAWPRAMETEISEETLQLMARLQEAEQAAQLAQQTQQTQDEPQKPAVEPLSGKFADRFTDGEPYWNGSTYVGRNLNVTFSSGQMNTSVYYLQDIYVRDIRCLATALGQDTYGKGYTEDAVELANRKNAIGAINGDFYYMGSLSVIVRNGELYRDSVDPLESVLALYKDGTMEVYEMGQFSVADLISRGVWQTWSFGPALLDANGKAVTEYTRKNPEANPRTAIGMVEPGHYMFIVVDGRQDGYSEGMTYVELAQLCEQLGLTVAYNLDGGGSTRMVFDGQTVSVPSEERELSDIVYVADVY